MHLLALALKLLSVVFSAVEVVVKHSRELVHKLPGTSVTVVVGDETEEHKGFERESRRS